MDELYQKIDGVIPLRHYPCLSRTQEDYARLIFAIAERTFESKCRALLHITARVRHKKQAEQILYYRNKALEARLKKISLSA